MKKMIVVVAALGLLFPMSAMAADAEVKLETEKQKLSYAMGLDLGEYFKNMEEELDLDILSRGMNDSYKGNPPLLSPEETAAVQQAFAEQQKQKQIKQTLAMIEKNKKAEEAFLAANKEKEGVMSTPSGLQYKVVKEAQGAKPGAEDRVKVHYRGTLLDGKEFDSSYSRNEPAVFKVNQVIAGWQEALQLMPVGSIYELYIPAALAYGDRGAPPVIEPGSI